MTSPDDQVPINPGQPYEPPTQPYPAQQPPPVYHQPAPQQSTFQPGKVAGNTVVVIATIVGLFVVLPLLCCGGWIVFGLLVGSADHH